MSDQVTHKSIGAREREEEAATDSAAQKKAEVIQHLTETPFRGYTIDQITIWAVWGIAVASAFLYCTVSAVKWAIG